MCQLYGSLGSERESLSRRHARRKEKGKGREDVETKDTLGEFQKGRKAGETGRESESKWIGELAELLRPAECLECRPG